MDVQELCSQAEKCLRDGEFKKAVVLLKKEAHRPFADLRLRSLFGLVMARSDPSFYGFYRGLKWCSDALEQQPEDPYLLVNLGKVYLYHGLRVKALEYMNRAMEIAPDDPVIRESRGLLGFRQRPKLPFIARKNPVNIILGMISVSLKKSLSFLNERKS
jgi:Flp pilus assembly protein TadD